MIKITFRDIREMYSEFSLTVREILAKVDFAAKDRVVACRVNRVQRSLSWKISMDSFVEFITTDSVEGIEVYNRTLSFMLTSAAYRKCDIRLHLRQSMNYSYY